MNKQPPTIPNPDPDELSARLSELPELAPHEDRWSQIRDALETSAPAQKPVSRSGQSPRWWPVALAAALALAVSLPWMMSSQNPDGDFLQTGPGIAQDNSQHPENRPGNADTGNSDLLVLQRQSQVLAAALRASQQYQSSLSGEAAIYAVELEDTIARMDQALAENPDSPTLWRGRVGLMTDLLAIYSSDDGTNQPMMI